MSYLHFNEEDFANDEFFQQWILKRDAESNLFWQNWLAEHPEKQPVIEKAQWIIQTVSFNETWTPSERTTMWQSIQSAINQPEKEGTPIIPLWRQSVVSGPSWRRLGWVAAASIAVLLVSFGLFYANWQINEMETSFGEIRQIKLADGSTVTLNAHSKLKLAANFLENPRREVWIEGEAFFDVAKRTVNGLRVPFVVHANNLTIRVLGTAFNVINRREKVDIALEQGSVNVIDEQNRQNTIWLKPGEKVSQLDKKAPLIKQIARIEDYTSWKENVILFRQKSLTEIAQMMKDMYNIDVVIDNPALKQETFTGSFPADSADVFFEKLKKMYPIDIHKDGEVFHLK